MSKKSISINPAFFKMSGGKNEKKKKKKPNFKSNIKPNDIKKKLIAKIKAHQRKEKEKEEKEDEKANTTFKNDFQETLSYLEEMKNKKKKQKEKRKRQKTMKKKKLNHTIKQAVEPLVNNISIDVEPMKVVNDPPYGCLKGGSKPTYRQYNKTLKKK